MSSLPYSDFLDSWDSLLLDVQSSDLQHLALTLQGGVPFSVLGHTIFISPAAAATYSAAFALAWRSRSHRHLDPS